MKQKTVKQILFVVIMILMILPFSQPYWFKVKGLKGYFVMPKKPTLTLSNLHSGTYQDSLTRYIEYNIGLRPDLVRLHNQYQYSLFGILHAQGVIVGKEGFLFEENYIKAAYGLDYVSDEKVLTDVQQTAVVNEWLRENGKTLLVVLAPGKGTYFEEYIPDSYKPETIGKRNYDEYLQRLQEHNIPVIGCNEWFLNLKDTLNFELFPQTGIHWGYYGLGLVVDSIVNTMEHLMGKKIADFRMDNLAPQNKLKSPDFDLWEILNLFIQLDHHPMSYPNYYMENIQLENRPRTIVVSDSYYWQWFNNGNLLKAFDANQFWYYNRAIYDPSDWKDDFTIENIDIMDEIAKTDFIMILQTDANMNRFSFGFIPYLYEQITKRN